MKDRIKKVRVNAKLNQSEFGKEISISRSAVWKLENGENTPSERTIEIICIKFGVNEKWLKTGEGEMYPQKTRNQEIQEFANEAMELPDDDFKRRFILALSRLDESDWKDIKRIAEKLIKED